MSLANSERLDRTCLTVVPQEWWESCAIYQPTPKVYHWPLLLWGYYSTEALLALYTATHVPATSDSHAEKVSGTCSMKPSVCAGKVNCPGDLEGALTVTETDTVLDSILWWEDSIICCSMLFQQIKFNSENEQQTCCNQRTYDRFS